MGKMVMLGVAALALALGAAGAAGAQRVMEHGPGAAYPPPGPDVRYPPMPPAPVQPVPGSRWGGAIGGRWWGGVNAPGGWAAYRAPFRGYHLPAYWVAPRFYVNDWAAYGLAAPRPGYFWTRYYDDAVLIDGRGDVFDWVGGVDWSRGEPGVARGPEHGRMAAPPAYGAGYGERYRHEERVEHHVYEHGPPPGGRWMAGDGRTGVTVTTTAGGPPVIYAPPVAYGYGYGYGGAVTTVTVESAPVVTTTTTEIIEDSVTYTRPVVRHVYRKRVWRPRPHLRARPSCVCGS